MTAGLPHIQSPTSLGDQAYATVREAIVTGVLPRGSKVTERGLAESLHISPTPVREALRRLEQDRLVVRDGPRSVRVAKFDDDELVQITMIEDALRAVAARLAAINAAPAQIEEMKVSLERAERLSAEYERARSGDLVIRISAALREFHASIDQASGSPTLVHMLDMVDAFSDAERRRFALAQVDSDPDTVRARFLQHREMFEAIAQHDPDAAEEVARAHSRGANRARVGDSHRSV